MKRGRAVRRAVRPIMVKKCISFQVKSRFRLSKEAPPTIVESIIFSSDRSEPRRHETTRVAKTLVRASRKLHSLRSFWTFLPSNHFILLQDINNGAHRGGSDGINSVTLEAGTASLGNLQDGPQTARAFYRLTLFFQTRANLGKITWRHCQ